MRYKMPTNVTQSPIYESYVMLHPDGTKMCHCNHKKAKWYTDRELADWVDQKTFKLRFEPNGYGKSDNPYYTQPMENKCVVCGADEQLNKHHVVPYVFRKRFPIEYKESNHHDIVATCVDCHENYEGYANEYKKLLAQNFGLKFNESVKSKERSHNKKISTARELLERLDKGMNINKQGKEIVIPEDRLKELKIIASKDMQEETYISSEPVWADKIVEKILEEDKLFEFVKAWREHFLQYAKPKNMPNHWSVESALEVSTKSLNKVV
jgi:hypothetical protein